MNPFICNMLFYKHCFHLIANKDFSSSDDTLLAVIGEYERLSTERKRRNGFSFVDSDGYESDKDSQREQDFEIPKTTKRLKIYENQLADPNLKSLCSSPEL